MTVEHELRRLFRLDELTVSVGPAAPFLIVAGARGIRHRRRVRTVIGVAAAATVLVAGGIASAGGLDGHPLPPAASPAHAGTTTPGPDGVTRDGDPNVGISPAPEPTATPRPAWTQPDRKRSTGEPSSPARTRGNSTMASPSASGILLAPNGYRQLTVGMTLAQAKNTGLLGADTGTGSPGVCEQYGLVDLGRTLGTVLVSDRDGVVEIAATSGHTAAGVGTGDTVAEVTAAYPAAERNRDGYRVATTSGRAFLFAVATDDPGLIGALRLLAATSDCPLAAG